MGDYRYTELSYKITSLISRTCCLGSSSLTYIYRLMREWCHLYAILIELLQQNTFNTFQLSVHVAVNITWDNNATCKAVYFYIRGFIYTSSYCCPIKQIWSPTLWHAVYHKPAVYIVCRGHGVSIHSNQYKIGNNQ